MIVSVLVSTMNRPAHIRECLNTILASTRMPDEILVVDQSVDDGTERVCRDLDPESNLIHYIRCHKKGVCVSRNQGIANAAGDIVAVTDDDCLVDAHWVENIEKTFAENPQAVAVSGRSLPWGEKPGYQPTGIRDSMVPRVCDRPMAPSLTGNGNNISYRRSVLLELGGYDLRFGPGAPGRAAEDMELFYRLLRHHRAIYYTPSVMVYHNQWRTLDESLRTQRFYAFGSATLHTKNALRLCDPVAAKLLLRRLADGPIAIVEGLVKRNPNRYKYGYYYFLGAVSGLVNGIRIVWRSRGKPERSFAPIE